MLDLDLGDIVRNRRFAVSETIFVGKVLTADTPGIDGSITGHRPVNTILGQSTAILGVVVITTGGNGTIEGIYQLIICRPRPHTEAYQHQHGEKKFELFHRIYF